MPRLFVAISGHGYGHLGQVSPLIEALRTARPEIELAVQCALPHEVVAARFSPPFQHIQKRSDVGMVMRGPLRLDVDASLAAYADFHGDWDRRLKEQMALLENAAPDLVLADVPYLPLAAAQRLDIPSVAVCSLHWAAILRAYCGETAQTRPWLSVMLAAYRGAECFLRPTPAMAMPELPNTEAIGPLACRGRNRRDEIDARLGLASGTRLVLLTLGGIAGDLPLIDWSRTPGIAWLVDRGRFDGTAAEMHPLSLLDDLPFRDLLASLDAVVTKPGYGMFTEAACNALPVLYLPRGDWPEEPFLIPWLERHGNARAITPGMLAAGALEAPLEQLWAQSRKPPVEPAGVDEGVERLLPLLS